MTRKLSKLTEQRLDAIANSEPECSRTIAALYSQFERVERLDRDLHGELTDAFLDAMHALLAAAWLDGWQCGRDPDRLVFTDGTLTHPDPGIGAL